MTGKHPSSYSIDEVCLWVFALGLGDKANAFREAAIDGDMLLRLGPDDFKELGLTSLQGKKIERGIEISTSFAEEQSSGNNDRITELENENAALRAQLDEYTNMSRPPEPAPAQNNAPTQAPKPNSATPPRGHVIKGAAGGALKGAVVGAVAGAICGDPAQGAKIGAATGATAGAMGGLGARRRARMARRF